MQIRCSSTSVRYAARERNIHVCDHVYVRPSVRLDAVRHRRATGESSLSETLEQIAFNARHTMCVRVHQLTRIGYQSATRTNGLCPSRLIK